MVPIAVSCYLFWHLKYSEVKRRRNWIIRNGTGDWASLGQFDYMCSAAGFEGISGSACSNVLVDEIQACLCLGERGVVWEPRGSGWEKQEMRGKRDGRLGQVWDSWIRLGPCSPKASCLSLAVWGTVGSESPCTVRLQGRKSLCTPSPSGGGELPPQRDW